MCLEGRVVLAPGRWLVGTARPTRKIGG